MAAVPSAPDGRDETGDGDAMDSTKTMPRADGGISRSLRGCKVGRWGDRLLSANACSAAAGCLAPANGVFGVLDGAVCVSIGGSLWLLALEALTGVPCMLDGAVCRTCELPRNEAGCGEVDKKGAESFDLSAV